MSRGLRSSVAKANKKRLKSKLFGPVEEARKRRLSAKLFEIVQQGTSQTKDDTVELEQATGLFAHINETRYLGLTRHTGIQTVETVQTHDVNHSSGVQVTRNPDAGKCPTINI